MRFACNRGPEVKQERVQLLKKWQPWFAWHPVPIGNRQCAWLEVVERRFPNSFIGVCSGNVYTEKAEYRARNAVNGTGEQT